MEVVKNRRVLIAALDWGIGHATRCVPIIRRLQKTGYEVILASNGKALDFFSEYFPELLVISKPGYNVTYSRTDRMTNAILRQLPSIVATIIREHLWLKRIISRHKISEVISDNCYGLWNRKIHSTFITHQVRIKCPPQIEFFGPMINRMISFFISRYDECYIPDNDEGGFSGTLSHGFPLPANAKFIGTLSRFSENKSLNESVVYDSVILLSGPEPQRTIFENKCVKLITSQQKKCCIIRGLPRSKNVKANTDEITWFNHLPDDELKAVLKNAKKVVCRSGYSTIMDLVEIGVKALLVPTPGQTEQEYLAQHNSYGELFETVEQNKLKTNDFFREVKRPAVYTMTPDVNEYLIL